MLRFRIIVYFLLFFSPCFGFGQNETKTWYFGIGTGLDFSSTPPSTISVSSMSTSEGCASIADAAGNLLFYTNGATVWDKTHTVMANGSGMAGHPICAQSSLILQKPGSSNLYYLFTNAGQSSLSGNICYSIIDMNLAAGNGSVTNKNVTLLNGYSLESMVGTKHCNGTDYWITAFIANTNNYVSFLLTSTGVQSSSVVTSVGPTILNGSNCVFKISPTGKKIAMQRSAETYLGDFDNSTGIPSNITLIQTAISAVTGYGCEFSPDGSKLYTTSYQGIIQYDLCQTNASAISSSSVLVYPVNYFFGSLQLACDGKIYVSHNSGTIPYCSRINNPNSGGTACNFVYNSISFSPQYGAAGLPNFPGNLFLKKASPTPFTAGTNTAIGCYGMQFNAVLTNSLSYCAATSQTPTGVSWNFGDPASGTNNISFANNPNHIFSSNGSYNVRLVIYYACGISNDTLIQTVTVNQNCISTISNSITCASLGSATITNAIGPGPFSYTWLPSNQTGSIAINLNPGTHSVNVYDAGANVTFSATTFFTPLVPLTGSLSSATNINCNGAFTGTALVSNIAGGSIYQNYLWTNGTQTTSLSNPTNLSAGNWTVTITDALTSCQVNSVFTITQPLPLVLNLSSNTLTNCAGNSIALTGTNSGGTAGYTYTWTNAPPSNTIVVSENTAGTYVYTLQSTDANNCLSSNTIALNFIANPVLSVPDVSICPLKLGTLTASGATSYTWTLSSTTLGLTGPTLTDNPLADAQYTVVGTALGCTSVATASIILYPSPVPVIQSNSPRCEGSSMNVNASGGSIYQWSGPSSFNSNLPFNTITNLALNHGGPYNLTVTSVNGCTASTSANLVVNPIPTVSAAGSTICTSQTLSLFANSAAGANYNWTGPATFVSAVQNPTLANPTLNRTGTYSVIATSVLGCTNIATAQVSVTSPPNLSVALSSNSLCAQAFNGSPNTVTLTGIGANTYTLYTPNLIGASAPVSPTTSVYATPPFSSTLAVGTATLEGSNGVCSSTASFVFTVVPNPTVGVNSFTPVICSGQNYTYTSNGANSYVWTATTPNYTTYSNGGIAVAHPSINSVFSVYGSSLGCNSALQTSSITVNPIPTLTLSAASNSICLNESTKLSVAGTGTSFTWSPATGLSNTTASSVVASPLASQSYTVLVSATNCTNSTNLYLTVLPLPKPIIDFVTPAVCLNGQISFKGSGGVLYEWRGPEHLYIQGQNPVFEALSSSYAGNYTLTVTDNNGCKSSTVTTVEILPGPSGYLTNFKEEACAPYCTTFNFLSSDKNKTVKSNWMINDQFLNGNTFSYCFSSAGTYTIKGTFFDETTNCKNTTNYLLNVHPKPKADFIFSPKQPIEGQDEVLFSNTSSGDGNLSFNWYFNDNKGYSTTQKNTSYLYNEPGEYRVVLLSKNQWKCADTIIKVVKVESDFALYVPNAFTPNGDERNDVFLPVVRSVKKYDLKIFDRWGKMIFQTTDPNQGWDGTFNGVMCKQDVYIWKILVVSLDGKEKSETGNVTSLPSE